MTKPEVTQEDRDLVVSFYSRSHATFWPDNFSKAMETCDEIKRGHCDNWELVQAVASHRQAAEQRGMERERERSEQFAKDMAQLAAHGLVGDWSIALREIQRKAQAI